MLFTERSLLTIVHGVFLGGIALMVLAVALFALAALVRPAHEAESSRDERMGAIAALVVFVAIVLWITVFTGTYILFPPYRAAPPAGLTDLAQYPRSLLLSSPETAWLHQFAMESKEHMPWIAAMLATAVGFVTVRYPRLVLRDPPTRRMATTLLAISFALAAFAGLMGIFINKVAPLE